VTVEPSGSSDTNGVLRRLDAAWDATWAPAEPIGFLIRGQLPHWVRFHMLPESKRYPESEVEYREVYRRHDALLRYLGIPRTSTWTSELFFAPDSQPPRADPDLQPGAQLWRIVGPLEGEDMPIAVYASVVDFRSREFDHTLRAVIDDRRLGGLIIPPEGDWLYHPYDGGADVVSRSPDVIAGIRSTFSDWLSRHPRGL